MQIKEIIEATNGQLLSGDMEYDVNGFTQDTRKIESGNMYIPLVGENADGHQYIAQAFNCLLYTSRVEHECVIIQKGGHYEKSFGYYI